MKRLSLLNRSPLLLLSVLLLLTGCNRQPPAREVVTEATQPPTPTNLVARDHGIDKGEKVDLSWDLTEDQLKLIDTFEIYKAIAFIGSEEMVPDFELIEAIPAKKAFHNGKRKHAFYTVSELHHTLTAKQLKKMHPVIKATNEKFDVGKFVFESSAKKWSDKQKFGVKYVFKVVAVGKVPPAKDGEAAPVPLRAESEVTPPLQTKISLFDGRLSALALIVLAVGFSVIYFISVARKGKTLKIRKIAGLDAVDEAVGRATEMGRSCLYIPGILDMNDIQTIAGMTVLSRVAKTAAEYDAKVEVPTCRSLVMTAARETVQASFLAAGRPDAYNADLIYYVTDEQFGYVAYLQGMMVREKPAACFYMGAFFAESLILAETGNSIGAIQVAGTAMPAQLPFFVAACDYTLIGEEFFAASAYLSGEPEQLGSLKGQDVGKAIVGIGVIIGTVVATVATITASPRAWDLVSLIVDKILA